MILVDTDVLIAHLRGDEAAYQWLQESRGVGPLLISTVTVTEILGGIRSAERREVRDLLAILSPAPVTDLVAREAGGLMRSYRRSHSGIGLGDYLIAATALTHSAQLATRNVRHFPMFPGLAPPF